MWWADISLLLQLLHHIWKQAMETSQGALAAAMLCNLTSCTHPGSQAVTHIQQRHLMRRVLVVGWVCSVIVQLCAHHDHLVQQVDVMEVGSTCSTA